MSRAAESLKLNPNARSGEEAAHKGEGVKGVALQAGLRGRSLERSLLLWNLPLVLLAAAGLASAQRHPMEMLSAAVLSVGVTWLGCFLLHLALCATRFDGDLLFLPLLSLLLTVGSVYHLGLLGEGGFSGFTLTAYARAALLGLAVLAVVTTGGKWFKRLNLLLEEKVWWKVAGDRPYYESVPFHLMLLGLMAVLGVLLLFKGLRAEGGALIQVRLFGVQFTPSEFIRLGVAFFLADYLGRNSRVLRNLRQPLGSVWPLNRLHFERRAELGVMLLTVGLYLVFFFCFKDFGPAVVILVLTLTALFAATRRWLTPALIGSSFLALVLLALRFEWFGTLNKRVAMWLDPWHTHFINGDHQARILWSIAAGGWYGIGPGTQKLNSILPLAQNDAAFAGVAATMGMWTGLGVLALYAAITWRGMMAARQAPTDRMRLLGFSLTGLLAFQAVWICGAMVRVFPFTGINVPFISTGLSSMIASALALGTVWNISRLASAKPDATEATPEVLRGVTRMALPVAGVFALPALALLIHGCPLILGDRNLTQRALGVQRGGGTIAFSNPFMERFRERFPRGRIFSADNKLLAVANPTSEDLDAIREVSPSTARYAERKLQAGSPERFYPLGSASAQLIGWNAQGRFAPMRGSIEATWDPLLRGYGPDDLPRYFRWRHNPLAPQPKPQDLQLSIDASVQEFATRRLAQAVKEAGGTGGAAVIFDATTGGVIAATTAPTFDPNGLSLERMQSYQAQHAKTQLLLNKALSREALYFPGSSFKILTAGAALEEGIQGAVNCRNGRNATAVTWEHDGRRYRRDPGKISDYSAGGHGELGLQGGMERAMVGSCNVFFAELAARLGADRLHRAMEQAEFAEVPSVRDLAEHLPYDGFGQIDVKASPLEMAQLAAAVGVAREDAPDAVAARPNWVQALVSKGQQREPEGLPGAPDRKPYRPFPKEVAQKLRPMLVSVVDDPGGTAHAAFFSGGARRLPGITVGGKTGTAEFEKKGGKIGRHAWFVGFARSDHELQPRTLAFAVLVEDVRRGGTGGRVCAPVARDLIARILPLPGQETPNGGLNANLDRFYREQIRPRVGPFGPVVDWLRDRITPRRQQ